MDTRADAPPHQPHPTPPHTHPPCFELPEWNRTIVIDRKAEETPHLTSTHAESNYTPSASALAPAWGFQRARGERMGVGIKAVEWWWEGEGGEAFLAGERENYVPPKKNSTLHHLYWWFKSCNELFVVVATRGDSSIDREHLCFSRPLLCGAAQQFNLASVSDIIKDCKVCRVEHKKAPLLLKNKHKAGHSFA